MIVFRSGAVTVDNFTPRLGKDTTEQAGKPPGLSTFKTMAALRLPPGNKVQRLDLDLLKSPLKPFPDEPVLGGTRDHVAIAPGDAEGNINQELLEEWAACRKTEVCHRLTQIVLDCIVEIDMRSSP